MSGSGTFRYKLFLVPKGNTCPLTSLPRLRTLWHHFLEGEFSPRGAQEQGLQLSLRRQGVQLRKKDFPK